MALPKSDPRYWQSRVHKVSVKGPLESSNNDWISPSFSVRLHLKGERHLVTLSATTKKGAAKEALELWHAIKNQGWDAASNLKRRNLPSPEATTVDPEILSNKAAGATIGSLIECYAASVGGRPQTQTAYFVALRALVAGVLEIAKKNSADKTRIEKINGVPLSHLTRERIEKWKTKQLSACTTPSQERSLKSRLVNARSVFNPKALDAFNEIHGTSFESPFLGIKMPRTSNEGHFRKVKLELLLRAAESQLAKSPDPLDVEQWKIILLVSCAGLRRAEVDNLYWEDIDLENALVHVRPKPGYKPKTDCSIGSIPIDEDIVEIMTAWPKGKPKDYVVPEDRHPTMKQVRAGSHFQRACAWLRAFSHDGKEPLASVQKPLHELRKEAGSIVAERFGLHAAKIFLRHVDIGTTSTYYLNSNRVASGIGKFLRKSASEETTKTPTAKDQDNQVEAPVEIEIIGNDKPAPKSVKFIPATKITEPSDSIK
jgi:integrase